MFFLFFNGWYIVYLGLYIICMVVVKCRSWKVESLEIYKLYLYVVS